MRESIHAPRCNFYIVLLRYAEQVYIYTEQADPELTRIVCLALIINMLKGEKRMM